MTSQPTSELDEIEARLLEIAGRAGKGYFDPRTIAADVLRASTTIRQLREQVSYLAGEPSPPATMNDYRAPELDAAVLALRNAGQDEAAQIIGRFRLEFRAAKDREITAHALLCELRGHFHDDGRTQIIRRELIEKIDAFAPAQSTASWESRHGRGGKGGEGIAGSGSNRRGQRGLAQRTAAAPAASGTWSIC